MTTWVTLSKSERFFRCYWKLATTAHLYKIGLFDECGSSSHDWLPSALLAAMSTLVEYRAPLNSYVSSYTQPVPPEQRDPSRAGDCILVRPSSSGWRNTSRTWRRNSGSSSRKSTPWWASDTSPGIGTWPPPISPASEMV
jgi:hypothetical protein